MTVATILSLLAAEDTAPVTGGITPAIATIIVAVVTVLGGVIGAAVSFWLNRNNSSADTAEKISRAWVPVFDKYDNALEQVQRQCDDCQTKLNAADEKWKQAEERARRYERRLAAAEKREAAQTEALRTLIRVYDANDPIELGAVVEKVRKTLNEAQG